MSLTPKRPRSANRAAASKANGSRSRGPKTEAGRERIRAANLRHGFYSKSQEVALRALGEDPAEFAELLEGLWERYNPTDALQRALVERQARAVWRTKRADRMQEGYALRQAQEVNQSRESRLHAQLMRLKMTEASLKSLAQSVAQEYYVTAAKDLELMQSLHQEGEVKEIGAVALALFLQLQAPGTVAGEPDEEEKERRLAAQSRAALQRFKEIFGLHRDYPPQVPRATPDFNQQAGGQPGLPQPGTVAAPVAKVPAQIPGPEKIEQESRVAINETAEARAKRLYPKITPEEWEKREPLRQLLENLLTRQAELCQQHAADLLRDVVKGTSPYERAAEIAPLHPNAGLMQRMEDSNFRQLWRTINMLSKLQGQGREEDEAAKRPLKPEKLVKTKSLRDESNQQ